MAPRYSYFSGCSTGGRQGQSEVQRYPEDYDGVMSGAPIINWAHIAGAEDWLRAVMKEHPVAQCKLDAAHRAAVAACDLDDGLRDGLVSSVGTCRYDPETLIGKQTECGVINRQDADVIRRIWDGPRRRDGSRVWNGVDPAVRILAPEPPPADLSTLPSLFGRDTPFATFEEGFDYIVAGPGAVMDTGNPDLTAFAKHGGKTIIWHGIADDTVLAAGSTHYFEAVQRTLGKRKANDFLRLYLAPGVLHCAGGDGPMPVGLFESLMDWVEHGRAPGVARSESWDASGKVTRTRPLCPYPQRARYKGRGLENDEASFRCSSS